MTEHLHKPWCDPDSVPSREPGKVLLKEQETFLCEGQEGQMRMLHHGSGLPVVIARSCAIHVDDGVIQGSVSRGIFSGQKTVWLFGKHSFITIWQPVSRLSEGDSEDHHLVTC